MKAEIVHSGFDGLKFTIETDIPPELRQVLFEAKAEATRTNRDTIIERNGIPFGVRRSGGMAFSVHTGDLGAEWYFLDPENRPANNPGVTVDFRAYLLATGGLTAAREHFEACMAALGIPYAETQLRLSRVDFAVDILAPWFEPEHEALVLPPGTRNRAFREADSSETFSVNARVQGLTAGQVNNRQLVIYDKRAEIIAKHKPGWKKIWDTTRANAGRPELDLAEPDESRVWRFELRMGSKCLRRRWEMRNWFDLGATVGDAYAEFRERIRYCIPQADPNRSRWPTHELWEMVGDVLSRDLRDMRSGVLPSEVRTVDREALMRRLDGLIFGNMLSRAAAEGIDADELEGFIKRHTARLLQLSREFPVPIDERLAKAQGRYRFL